MNLVLLKGLRICTLVTFGIFAGCKEDTLEVEQKSAVQTKQPTAIARGKLDVEGGLVALSFSAEGVVNKIMVAEGQQVEKGQLLLQQDQRISNADQRVAESELAVADTQLQGLRDKIPELQQKAQRLNLAAQAGAMQMQLSDEAQVVLQQAQTEISIAQAERNLAKSKLSQIQSRGALLNLHAPFAATVVKINAHSGEFLANGQSALVLLPKKPIIVRAELNESYLQSVKVGMQAKVQIDHDSDRTDLATARVTRISPVFIQSQLQQNSQQSPGRVVECILEFNTAPLTRVGQNVIVSFYDQP